MNTKEYIKFLEKEIHTTIVATIASLNVNR